MVDARRQIAVLEERLRETPRAEQPLAHAHIRYALGLAYAELPSGPRELNLARAVKHYLVAAELFAPDEYPVEHARVLIAQGAAYRELRELGRAQQVLHRAVELLTAAVDQPAELAAAWNNLGLVLLDAGDHEQARAHFGRAVELFEMVADRRQWAIATYNLSQALAAAGEHEATVATCEAALQVIDPQELPFHWGLLQHMRGLALTAVGRARDAVDAFTAALRVFTRQRYPLQHAFAKNNLGLALAQLGDDLSLRRAVGAFEDALAHLDPRIHRDTWQQAYRNLDLVEHELRRRGLDASRAEHFAAVLSALEPSDRLTVFRERLLRLLQLPQPQRAQALTELELAVLKLPPPAAKAVTGTWLQVLMELPNEHVVDALRARLRAMRALDPEQQERAGEMLEIAIREELLAPQRIRIRDTLTMLGYERRW